MADDPFDLARFVAAQDHVFGLVCNELRQGQKRSHWIWYIFPQIAGLGFSDMARKYAISSLAEAQAYLAHPVLGPRLIEATQLVCAVQDRTILQILGAPDDMKFRSCMTLFARAAPDNPVFAAALAKYFDGTPDAATLQKL
jgi:uncharacterized protein (DUF1810 family)